MDTQHSEFKFISEKLQNLEASIQSINTTISALKLESTDEILDVKGAAKLLKSTEGAIYLQVHEGKIPRIKHGSRTLFSKKSLLKFLLDKEVYPLSAIMTKTEGIVSNYMKSKR